MVATRSRALYNYHRVVHIKGWFCFSVGELRVVTVIAGNDQGSRSEKNCGITAGHAFLFVFLGLICPLYFCPVPGFSTAEIVFSLGREYAFE